MCTLSRLPLLIGLPLFLVLTACAAPFALDVPRAEPGQATTPPLGYRDLCRRDPTDNWCQAVIEEVARDIHFTGLGLFNWAPDKERFGVAGHWASFIHEFRAGESFTGDCDDFVLTLADAARDAGVADRDIAIVICLDETGGLHSVLMLGGKWILDNRQRRPMLRSSITSYTWIKFMNAAAPGEWHTFASPASPTQTS